MPIGIPVTLVTAPGSLTGYAGGASSVNDTAAVNVPAGSLIVLYLQNGSGSATITSVTDSNGNSYSVTNNTPASFTGMAVASTITTAQLHSGSTWTATTSGGVWFLLAACYATGIISATPDAASSFANNTTGAATTTTGTLAQGSEIVLGFLGTGGSFTTYTESAGFTSVTRSNGAGVSLAYDIVSSNTPVTFAPTYTLTTQNWRIFATAFLGQITVAATGGGFFTTEW